MMPDGRGRARRDERLVRSRRRSRRACAADAALLPSPTSSRAGQGRCRDPIRTAGGDVVAAAPLPSPQRLGRYTIIEMWWNFQEQHRIGERTLSWTSAGASEHYTEPFVPHRPSPRPSSPSSTTSTFRRIRPLEPRPIQHQRRPRAYGWPFCCLWRRRNRRRHERRPHHLALERASPTAASRSACPALSPSSSPRLPLWPGLLTDTALYALLCFALIRERPQLSAAHSSAAATLCTAPAPMTRKRPLAYHPPPRVRPDFIERR